jgi:hypothetical protein
MSASSADAVLQLSAASTRMHPDDIVLSMRAVGPSIGLHDVCAYLVDLEQRSLVPVPVGDGTPTGEALGVDSTVAGRAYRTETPIVANREDEEGDGTVTVWLPLLDSAERLGVVSAKVDREGVDEGSMLRWTAFASACGEIIHNKMAYGDSLTFVQRTKPVSLAAEMRWAMLPPLTFTGRNVAISGIVLPPYDVAGDTFDYAVNGNMAHFAILDAVGHGLESSRIANLAVSTYRSCRRRSADLLESYQVMDGVLAAEFGPQKFATAQLATLDLASGTLRWLNAGHPLPMLIRQGHRIDLASEVAPPIGIGPVAASLTEASLQPGDILLLFTDGITEARSADGTEFGRERLADFTERAAASAQTPAETVRQLSHAVLEHQQGVLQDDATLLLVSWAGPPAG